MIALVQQKKKISINFSKANTKLCISLHWYGSESYLHVNKTEIYEFKAKDNISWYNFCVGSVLQDFTKDEQSEILCTIFQLTIVSLKKRHS